MTQVRQSPGDRRRDAAVVLDQQDSWHKSTLRRAELVVLQARRPEGETVGHMVITRRSASGMAAIWLAAVIGVSATAWVAIDRAGRDLTNDIVKTMPATPVIIGTTAPQPSETSPRPSATRTPVATGKPSVKPKPAPAVVNPGTPGTPGTPATPAPRAPTSIAPPGPTPQDRTRVVLGGRVSVRCTGTSIALRFAQPEFGWRVQVDTFTVVTIKVSFRTGDEESQRTTQVTAACPEGVPAFEVSNG